MDSTAWLLEDNRIAVSRFRKAEDSYYGWVSSTQRGRVSVRGKKNENPISYSKRTRIDTPPQLIEHQLTVKPEPDYQFALRSICADLNKRRNPLLGNPSIQFGE